MKPIELFEIIAVDAAGELWYTTVIWNNSYVANWVIWNNPYESFMLHTPWEWTCLPNEQLLNLDVESMTNVHLSHRKCISAKHSTLFQHLCMFFGTWIDQLLNSLQAMQACYRFGTWAAYQDAAWQLFHLGICITPKLQTPNTHN